MTSRTFVKDKEVVGENGFLIMARMWGSQQMVGKIFFPNHLFIDHLSFLIIKILCYDNVHNYQYLSGLSKRIYKMQFHP